MAENGTCEITVEGISHDELLDLIKNEVNISSSPESKKWKIRPKEYKNNCNCFWAFFQADDLSGDSIVGISDNSIYVSNQGLIIFFLNLLIKNEMGYFYAPNVCMPEQLAIEMGRIINLQLNGE
jgi:hypothetical protein